MFAQFDENGLARARVLLLQTSSRQPGFVTSKRSNLKPTFDKNQPYLQWKFRIFSYHDDNYGSGSFASWLRGVLCHFFASNRRRRPLA
jgi:hypothetical protein